MVGMDIERKQTLISLIRVIIRSRWIIILVAGLLGFVQQFIGAASVNLSFTRVAGLVGFATFMNIVYLHYLKRGVERSDTGVKLVAISQVLVDQLIYTVIIYSSGGVESLSFFFYFLTILISVVLFSTAGILLLFFWNIILYLSVIFLEYYQIIPHQPRYNFTTGIYQNFSVTISNTFLVVAVIIIGTILGTFLSKILRRRQEELRIERDKTKSVVVSFTDGLILLNENEEIEFLNPRVSKMLGFRQASVEGRRAEDLASGRFRYLKNVLEATPDRRGQLPKVMIEQPRKIVIQVTTAPIVGEKGKKLGSMKILHDITREELIDRLKTEFVSIASHQLRTPLSAIKWAIAYVLGKDTGRLTAEQQEILQMAYESNERMIALVNDLLNISRIEEGKFNYEFKQSSPAELIKQALQELSPLIKSRKIKVTWQRPKNEKPLWLDPNKMLLAIQNVIENAVKYSKAEGRVTVLLDYGKMGAELKVIDQGIGIPYLEQKRLFSKFFRGSSALKQQTEGSGLGLFIVKNIIEGHDGQILIKSKEKEGTEVTITLPYKQRKPKAV